MAATAAPRRARRAAGRGAEGRSGADRLARLLLFAALVAILLWPVAWNGGPLGFPDTEAYYEQGGAALDYVGERLGLDFATPIDTGPGAAEGATVVERTGRMPNIRSVPFAIGTNLTVRAVGLMGPVIVLAALTAWLILLAVRHLPPWRAALAALVAAGATTLPFYASQIMADVTAGWLILIACLIALRPAMGGWTIAAVLALAFLSIASHYSHVPLGMALMPALGLVLLVRRRWGLAAAVQLPLVLAMGLNVAVGKLTTGGVSLAPARLPILLARTLADGPGGAYLEEVCPEAGWTLCEVYDEFPTSVRDALWGPDSIANRASVEQRRAIAREEVPLVLSVLRAYPVEQGTALARNAVAQLGLIGMDDVRRTEIEIEGHREAEVALERLPRGADVLVMEQVQWGAVAAGLLGLVVALWRGGPGVRPAIALLALGLATNAAVCGGLSAPADRYQGRVIWTLVLLGLALALGPREAREPEGWILDRRGRRVRPGARGSVRRA